MNCQPLPINWQVTPSLNWFKRDAFFFLSFGLLDFVRSSDVEFVSGKLTDHSQKFVVCGGEKLTKHFM